MSENNIATETDAQDQMDLKNLNKWFAVLVTFVILWTGGVIYYIDQTKEVLPVVPIALVDTNLSDYSITNRVGLKHNPITIITTIEGSNSCVVFYKDCFGEIRYTNVSQYPFHP